LLHGVYKAVRQFRGTASQTPRYNYCVQQIHSNGFPTELVQYVREALIKTEGFTLAQNITEYTEQGRKNLGFLKQQDTSQTNRVGHSELFSVQSGINMALKTHLNTINKVTAVYNCILTYFFGIIKLLIQNYKGLSE
jgi:hypothetical protein